jgi:hypothetical protein
MDRRRARMCVRERRKAVLQGVFQRDQPLPKTPHPQEQVMSECCIAIPVFQCNLNVIWSDRRVRGVIAQIPAWVLENSWVHHRVSFLKQKPARMCAGFAIGSPILAPTKTWGERPSKRIGSMPPSLMMTCRLNKMKLCAERTINSSTYKTSRHIQHTTNRGRFQARVLCHFSLDPSFLPSYNSCV